MIILCCIDFFIMRKTLVYPHDGMKTLSIDIDFSFITQLEDDTTALNFIESCLLNHGFEISMIINTIFLQAKIRF